MIPTPYIRPVGKNSKATSWLVYGWQTMHLAYIAGLNNLWRGWTVRHGRTPS